MPHPLCDRPLPALIGLAFATVTDGALAHVRSAGFLDLELHHLLNVLRFLTPGGDRPARLAEQAGVTPQAMSLLLADLERRGYVVRRPDPADGRARIVTLSERGTAAALAIEDWFQELETRWAAVTGTEQLAQARLTLGEIVAAERSW